MNFVVSKNAKHELDVIKSLKSEDWTKTYFAMYPFSYNIIRSTYGLNQLDRINLIWLMSFFKLKDNDKPDRKIEEKGGT